MKRLLLASITGLVLFGANSSQAQNPSYPSYTPGYGSVGRGGAGVVNPILNLRRGANTPGTNYFLGTLPEFDRRNTKAEQGAAILDLERRAGTQQGAEDLAGVGEETLP